MVICLLYIKFYDHIVAFRTHICSQAMKSLMSNNNIILNSPIGNKSSLIGRHNNILNRLQSIYNSFKDDLIEESA